MIKTKYFQEETIRAKRNESELLSSVLGAFKGELELRSV